MQCLKAEEQREIEMLLLYTKFVEDMLLLYTKFVEDMLLLYTKFVDVNMKKCCLYTSLHAQIHGNIHTCIVIYVTHDTVISFYGITIMT